MIAVVLAGGAGTRLRDAIPKGLPKVLAPVRGRPFLAHLLDYWSGEGVTRFILSLGYQAVMVEAFAAGYRGRATIECITERHPLGTGGAVRLACSQIPAKTPFLVINGDTFAEAKLAPMREALEREQAHLAIASSRQIAGGRFGCLVVDAGARVTGLTKGVNSGEWMNAGVFLFRGTVDVPPEQESDDLEAGIIEPMIRLGKTVIPCLFTGRILDIGTPSDYAASESLFELEGG